MARGGKREGAGRKPGSLNQKTVARLEAVAASGLTPLEYMLEVLRNTENTLAVRMDAAKNAAPYLHPKLATTEWRAPGLEESVGQALAALIEKAQEAGDGVRGMVKG